MKIEETCLREPKRRKPHANTDDIQIGQGWDVFNQNKSTQELAAKSVIPKYVKERDVAFGELVPAVYYL